MFCSAMTLLQAQRLETYTTQQGHSCLWGMEMHLEVAWLPRLHVEAQVGAGVADHDMHRRRGAAVGVVPAAHRALHRAGALVAVVVPCVCRVRV